MRKFQNSSCRVIYSLSRLLVCVEIWVALIVLSSINGALGDVKLTNSEPRLNEIQELIKKRKWEEAAVLCGAYMKLDPNSVPGWFYWTNALVQLNRREEALAVI